MYQNYPKILKTSRLQFEYFVVSKVPQPRTFRINGGMTVAGRLCWKNFRSAMNQEVSPATLAQPDYGQLETPGDTLATTRGGESPVGVPVLCSLDCKKVDVDRGEELMSESHRRTIGIF